MSKRVLVVEDDPSFRTLVRVTLADRGFEVVEVTRAERARALLEEQRFDLLIVDGLLPDGSGVNFIVWARTEGYEGPILFISRFWKDLKTFRSLTEEWKVSRVLSKPITAAQLTLEVDSIFRPERLRQHARRSAEGASGPVREEEFEQEMMQLRRNYAEQFAQSLAEGRDALAQARESGDREVLDEGFRRVHSLAGSAGSFGFKASGKRLRGIELEIEGLVEKPETASDHAWKAILASLDAVPAAFESEARSLLPDDPNEVTRPGGLTPGRHCVARVLVVDDDASVLANLELIGRQHMIEVVTARDADGAVAAARGTRLDGAVLDIHLGRGHTGYDVARRLRVEAGHRGLPMAFFSSDTSLMSRVRAAHAGASLFLDKAEAEREFPTAVRQMAAQRQEVRPRVIVLVDDLSLAESVGSALEASGLDVDVDVATDPASLIETLETQLPSLLLVQASMRRVSGFDICKMVRNTTDWRDLPILLVTETEDRETRRACFDAGADDFVGLPLDLEEMEARLKVMLDRVRLHRERADRDALTGLLMRRAFLEGFKARFSEAQRGLIPLSLCVLDLDQFKKLNDSQGHAAGDRVLAAFGHLLASRFRASDLRARWGGEEFAVVLYGEEAEVTQGILERVLEEFRELEFDADDGGRFRASFSAGVASYPRDGASFQALFRVADERLYRAKEAGRSRVCAEAGELAPTGGRLGAGRAA